MSNENIDSLTHAILYSQQLEIKPRLTNIYNEHLDRHNQLKSEIETLKQELKNRNEYKSLNKKVEEQQEEINALKQALADTLAALAAK
jgi:hypothetical protein